MKTYHGYRNADGATIFIEEDGTSRPLELRLDLRNHSPDGFEWGYTGSGPMQLALAMCADALKHDAHALDVYREFAFGFVAKLPRAGQWEITAVEVLERIASLQELRAPR